MPDLRFRCWFDDEEEDEGDAIFAADPEEAARCYAESYDYSGHEDEWEVFVRDMGTNALWGVMVQSEIETTYMADVDWHSPTGVMPPTPEVPNAG
jgi:hypothetical protein